MARLPQGVRRRKDGTLEKRFTMNGVRYSVYAGTTKELAEKEQELREQIRSGTYKNNRNITLDNYFNEWIENRKRTTKENTLKTYNNYYQKHIKDIIGSCKIKDIERRQVLDIQKKASQDITPNSANMIIKTLKIVLNDAIKDEIITKNPANNIKALKVEQKATDTKHRALTDQEQILFMQALKGSYYYYYIALMLLTGMRCGEVGALTWQDIDFKNNMIHVNKTLTRDIKGKLIAGDTPKTDAGLRDIPINENIKNIITEYKKQSDILPFITNNVFVSPYGKFIDNGVVNREIRNTLKKLSDAGTPIEHFTSHALRDTFATRYIEQGGTMQTLKTILGHNSITMTMDLYAHVLPDTKQAEMQKIVINI